MKGDGHPILAVILGILGIVAAVVLIFLTGWIGFGVAALFGVLAIVLGISAKRAGNGGIGGMISGILAILAAVGIILPLGNVAKEFRNKAEEANVAPHIVEYMDNLKFGVFGFAVSASQSGVDEEIVKKEIDDLTALFQGKEVAPAEDKETPAETQPAEEAVSESSAE